MAVLAAILLAIGSVWRHRASILCVVTPLALLPLVLVVQTLEAKAAYVIILISVYWNFEVLPLGVTALLPVLLVPMLGILPSYQICPTYFKDSNMLFLGGLIMAVSIEAWGLHKRIALRVLLLVGVQPRWLILGFLFPTWLLSMWISNTAATAMMLPIAQAVLKELRKHYESTAATPASVNAAYSSSDVDDEAGIQETKPPKPQQQLHIETKSMASSKPFDEVSIHEFIADKSNAEFAGVCKMLILSVAYGAVFGGVATVTGTTPNVIFNGIVQEYFGYETPFNFSNWMFYALPVSVACLVFSWVWLQLSFLGCRAAFKPKRVPASKRDSITEALRKDYDALGSLTFAEIEVLVLFALTISLWISREPGGNGWKKFFQYPNRSTGKVISYMSDAQPAILTSILLFVLPSQNPFRRCCFRWKCSCCCHGDGEQQQQSARRQRAPNAVQHDEDVVVDGMRLQMTEDKPARLLTWRLLQEKVAWHIVLMLGCGLALAETSKESGLSEWIGKQLSGLGNIPLPGLVFIFCFCSSILTELTSNGASATILLPILASFSERINLHPFYLMLPSTASCSFAFILPISTPANIMVYSQGYLTAFDMTKTGIVTTIISNSIVAAATLSYAPAIFDLANYPVWAAASNLTAAAGP